MISDKPEEKDESGTETVSQPRDLSRRNFLTTAASAIGGIGLATLAWPFISSLQPSAHAKAAGAPVTIDLDKLGEGELMREEWRGKPIWVVRRTQAMLDELQNPSDLARLRDPASEVPQQPEYARNEYRSIKPEYLVLVGICTHLGCSPAFRPDVAPDDLGAAWEGGFFCACHGSRFDLAGRVYKNVPAPKNLEVPPYRYVTDNRIIVGESDQEDT